MSERELLEQYREYILAQLTSNTKKDVSKDVKVYYECLKILEEIEILRQKRKKVEIPELFK